MGRMIFAKTTEQDRFINKPPNLEGGEGAALPEAYRKTDNQKKEACPTAHEVS